MTYHEELAEIPPATIAYVDETGIDNYLYREYAYSPRGEPVYGEVIGRRYKRTGLVAAQLNGKILAPLQYDGTMDSKLFEYWFGHLLMRELPANSVVVMDNAAFHRKSRLPLLSQSFGHRLIFLPPYSPELNPIEHFWAWIKKHLRKILPLAESLDDALFDCFQLP